MKLFNTLSRKEEEFKPLHEGEILMYSCGPTVYAPDHLGQIKTWIFFDFLKRFFLEKGYKVKLVQNITDIGHLVGDEETGEDKIEKQAQAEHKSPEEIARHFETEHVADLKHLNFLPLDAMPRATDYIDDIIEFIKVLIEKGFAYEKNGSVYFDVTKDKDYGKLSGRKLDELVSGTRIEVDKNKKHSADFVLWKKATPEHLQKWPSPWGQGYPAWHIECSVMSEKLLGQPFDIHGSGMEHVFPHHENEIAQSECRFGKPLANFWLHTGMLSINGEKMGKSKGNYITVKDAIQKYSPDTIRLFILSGLWRKPLDWNERALTEARKMAGKLSRAKEEADDVKTGYKLEIQKALEDDFNTPKALSIIFSNLEKLGRDDFSYIQNVFGLSLEEKVKLTKVQENMVEEREILRKKGEFAKADQLRQILEKEGVIVEDTTEGTRILRK